MKTSDESLLHKVMDLLLDTVCVVDPEGRFVFVSASCETLLGYTPEELIGTPMIDLVFPEDKERTLQAAAAVMDGRSHIHFENRYIHKEGRIVDIMWSARWSEEDQLRLAVARDITVLKYAARKQEALYKISEATFIAEDMPAIYRHIHHIVFDVIPSDLFLVAGYDKTQNLLTFPYSSAAGREAPKPQLLAANSPLAQVIHGGDTLMFSAGDSGPGEEMLLPGIGDYSECLIAPLISPKSVIGALVMARTGDNIKYTGADKDLLQFVSTQIAIAIERKDTEKHLQHLATHDPLTDLPNRTLFSDRFDVALNRARRDNEHLALLYLDLDNFKEINDRYGHVAGDSILRELADRLIGCVRKSDTVARVGGDEFTVLLVNVGSLDCVHALVDKILNALTPGFMAGNHPLTVNASIGVAIYPLHGEDKEKLFRHADGHMYEAKKRQPQRRQN